MDQNILEEVDLSKREAKAYLALLEIGSSTVGNIIKKTDIPSSKIYEVLDRLISKGFVNYVIEKHQKHFQAADPETVLSYIDEKRNNLKRILPGLKERQKLATDRQEVELYVGKQAIFTLLYGLIDKAKKGDEYLSFSVGNEHSDPEIATFYTNFTWKRKDKGLRVRVIANEQIRETYTKIYPKEVLEAINNRFIDFHFPQGIVVLNECVVMLSWKENPSAILIKSKAISRQYREFFYELYHKGKK